MSNPHANQEYSLIVKLGNNVSAYASQENTIVYKVITHIGNTCLQCIIRTMIWLLSKYMTGHPGCKEYRGYPCSITCYWCCMSALFLFI